MSYIVGRRGYNGLGVDPVSGGSVGSGYNFGFGAPPKAPTAPAAQSQESWWKKLLGAGASVITDYGAAQRASAEAQLLAQQQAAMGTGPSLLPIAAVGAAVVLAVVLLRRKK